PSTRYSVASATLLPSIIALLSAGRISSLQPKTGQSACSMMLSVSSGTWATSALATSQEVDDRGPLRLVAHADIHTRAGNQLCRARQEFIQLRACPGDIGSLHRGRISELAHPRLASDHSGKTRPHGAVLAGIQRMTHLAPLIVEFGTV